MPGPRLAWEEALTDESLNDKRTADRLKREIQAADAPKAWAAYVGQIQRTRARTATLREEAPGSRDCSAASERDPGPGGPDAEVEGVVSLKVINARPAPDRTDSRAPRPGGREAR